MRRAFRPRRALPAAVTAAVLAIVAIFVLVEVIAALLHRPAVVLPVAWLARLGRDLSWDHPITLAVAAAVTASGLLLLALALSPGRPPAIPLNDNDPDVLMGVTPYALRRYAECAAGGVQGITRARVRVGRRRVWIEAVTPLHDTRGLIDEIGRAVEQRLEALALLHPPQLRINVRHRKE
jgi:hypothetical protein